MSEASPEVRTTSTVVALVALELVIDNTAYTVTSSSNNLMSELENSTLVTVGSTTSLCSVSYTHLTLPTNREV